MNNKSTQNKETPHVVIIGGGFGGLYAAKALRRAPVRVTLIDKRNFHLFQPLLYQVATGMLSPGDIASPLRAVLYRYKNIKVLYAEAMDIDPKKRKIILRDGELSYDYLIVATGASHHYFGNDDWAGKAPGLKTIEGALDIRRRIYLAFEAAERETDPVLQQALLTFIVVGGGPTGVELAGALGELAHNTLKKDFRSFDPDTAKIYLVEGQERILSPYPAKLSAKAQTALEKRGVTVICNTMVTEIQNDSVTLKSQEREEVVTARNVLWAAGVKASSLGEVLAERTGAEMDRDGRVKVEPDLSLPNHFPVVSENHVDDSEFLPKDSGSSIGNRFDPLSDHSNIFVIGDLAHCAHQHQKPLPGLASVAMQQGKYVASAIKNKLRGKSTAPFKYRDKGQLAVIGRSDAIVDVPRLRASGFFAWLIWAFVHVRYLVEFDNKVIVMLHWAWNYFTRKRGTRLITGEDPFPLVQSEEKEHDELSDINYLASFEPQAQFDTQLVEQEE